MGSHGLNKEDKAWMAISRQKCINTVRGVLERARGFQRKENSCPLGMDEGELSEGSLLGLLLSEQTLGWTFVCRLFTKDAPGINTCGRLKGARRKRRCWTNMQSQQMLSADLVWGFGTGMALASNSKCGQVGQHSGAYICQSKCGLSIKYRVYL